MARKAKKEPVKIVEPEVMEPVAEIVEPEVMEPVAEIMEPEVMEPESIADQLVDALAAIEVADNPLCICGSGKPIYECCIKKYTR